MRPALTSLPVVTMPTRRSLKGTTSQSGSVPAAAAAWSSTPCSMTSGITRMPASLSPVRTAVLPRRVAIMTCSTEFTARRASLLTRKHPS